jgi:hypothetical protein
VTGERLVRSWRSKELLEIQKEVLYTRKSFAEQMMKMANLVSKMGEVKNLEDVFIDIKADFHMVDSALNKCAHLKCLRLL